MKTLFWTLLTVLITSTVYSRSATSLLKSMLSEAAQTACEIKEDTEIIEGFKQRVFEWKERLDIHNANEYTYREGHHEECEYYEREREEINEVRQDLENDAITLKIEEREARVKMNRNHHSLLLAKIRINKLLQSAECECKGKSTLEAEVECYQVCWENSNDPGYTVPGPK